jgi:hypothetical protein
MEAIDLQTVLVPTRDLLSSTVADAVVILQLSSGRYYSLDGVGVRIWELLQEKRTLASICSIIETEFGVDAALCRDDLIVLCRSLRNAGLVVLEQAPVEANDHPQPYRSPVLYEHGPLARRTTPSFETPQRHRRLRRLRPGYGV